MWNQTISFLQLQTIYQLQIFNTYNSDIWCKMFLGSRTSFELCECIPLVAELPRRCPEVEFAQYTKNHAWMSAMINLESSIISYLQLRRCGCQLQHVFNYSVDAYDVPSDVRVQVDHRGVLHKQERKEELRWAGYINTFTAVIIIIPLYDCTLIETSLQ